VFGLADRSASTFVEADQRKTVFDGQIFGVNGFTQACFGGRATFQGEVFAPDNNPATINLAKAEDEVGGRKLDDIAVLVHLGLTRAAPYFVERIGVEDSVDPFADRQLALVVMFGDGGLATLEDCEASPLSNLIYFVFPAHGVDVGRRGGGVNQERCV
jgi:hypothetical protein